MTSVPFFEEKQKYPAWISWIAVFICMGIATLVMPVFFERLNKGQGDVMELSAVIVGILLLVVTLGVLPAIYHLTVTVDHGGVSYLYFPSFFKPKRIPAASISSFEFREVSFSDFGTKHPSTKPKREVCVLSNWTVADIELVDGSRVVLGTANPDGLRWALKKLQPTS